MDRIKEKDISGLLLWVVVAAGLAALSARVALLALAIPLAIAYMIARFGASGGAAGIAAISAAAVFSPGAAAAFAAAFVPVSVTAGVAIRQKKRFQNSVIAASVAALAGIVLCTGLLWLLKGLSPADYAVQQADALFTQLGDADVSFAYQSMRYSDMASGAVTQQAVLSTPRIQAIAFMLNALREAVNYVLVPAILVYSLLMGLVCYLAPRRAAMRRGIPVKAIPDFSNYAVPKRFWIAFLVSYLCAMLGDSLGLAPFGMLEPSVMAVYGFVFIVQALSFADFMYKARGMGKGMRTAMHTITVLLLGGYLMWVGIFENIVQFRNRMQEKGGEEF